MEGIVSRRNNAPYWLVTRFGGKCCQCGFGIKKGEDALYFPATKKVMCAGDGCGKQYQRDVEAARFDEEVYHYQG
jgi:hypothetical protein